MNGFCWPSLIYNLCIHVSTCVDDMSSWMIGNWLLLNPANTEGIWCHLSISISSTLDLFVLTICLSHLFIPFRAWESTLTLISLWEPMSSHHCSKNCTGCEFQSKPVLAMCWRHIASLAQRRITLLRASACCSPIARHYSWYLLNDHLLEIALFRWQHPSMERSS